MIQYLGDVASVRPRGNRGRISSQNKKWGGERPWLDTHELALKRKKYSDCVFDGAEICIWLKCFFYWKCLRGLKLFFPLCRKLSRESFLPPFLLLILYTSYLDLASLFLSLSRYIFLVFFRGPLICHIFNKTHSWLTTKVLYLQFVGFENPSFSDCVQLNVRFM